MGWTFRAQTPSRHSVGLAKRGSAERGRAALSLLDPLSPIDVRGTERNRAPVLLGDGLAPPLGGPVEVCAVAKRDLKAGETLDDYGMFMTMARP
jgi:hypothetical protein